MARILVIDPSIAIQVALQLCLEQAGHTIIVANDGESGIQAAVETPPDLFLISAGKPLMGGVATCQAIKKNPALCSVPVVITTGGSAAAIFNKARAAGALDVLQKPFEIEHLKAAIRHYLVAGKMPPKLESDGPGGV